MSDVNLELAGLLLDMAALTGNSRRGWGYKRAAKAVLRLEAHITPLVEANTFRGVPGIGPTTDRIARELIHDGRSDFVERAVHEAGKDGEIAAQRGLRRHFLSRAAVHDVVGRRGGLSRAKYRGDFQIWDRVFEIAARRQVAIEIDGSWDRQDVHYELAARALEHGCLFALDSDAHSHPELDFIDIAIAHATLAAIPQDRIINYWTEARFLKWTRGAWDR